MVVANFSTRMDDERHQLQDIAIDNFCPRLKQAVSLLSQHKVGPLKQQVQLSNFQSSSTCSLPINDSILNVRATRNDMFVLALPFLSEEMHPVSNDNMVKWLIITQCERPDMAPEVILLGLDSFSYLRVNQRYQYQTYQIAQEFYWQQYVASDSFQLQCIAKWTKINEDSFLSQFCLLADQLYECYNNFQLYKLKMSLKCTSPPVNLVQAYTQFKQLSKSAVIEIDMLTTYIGVELCVDLETAFNTLGFENQNNQKRSVTPSVRMRAIISIKSAITEINKHDDYKVQLASVTVNFLSNSTYGTFKKNSNKEYSIQILNPKLNSRMLSLALDSITPIDFALYVFKVQQTCIELYNCDTTSNVYDVFEESSNGNPIQLIFDALHKEFCDALPDNQLIDYQMNDSSASVQNTKNLIRFLLVDNGNEISGTSKLQYILTIEFNEEVVKESENTHRFNNFVPMITLRSVYDDESSEHNLSINVADITSEIHTDPMKYNKLAMVIKTSVLNSMHRLRCKSVKPVLTRYYSEWSPSDSYYLSSLTKPPPYKI